MILTDTISNLRIELQDTAQLAFTDDDLKRAIEKSVALMSRLIPKRGIAETTVILAITDEAVTVAVDTATLAYKPVKSGSLTLKTTPGDVTKTLDTDYTINYLTGVITEKSSGLPNGSYLATYIVDPMRLDLSSLLPNFIKIERVEYPINSVPPAYISSYDIIGDLLVLRGNAILTANSHIRLLYSGAWTPPTAGEDGDYPAHLDSAIIIGSVGQALIFRAEHYVGLAADLVEAAQGSLASISTPLADADTALDASATASAAARTALSGLTSPQSLAVIALGKIAGELVLAKGFLTTGAPFINAANRGAEVGATYGQYAEEEIRIATGYASEASQDVGLAGTYLDKSTRENAASLSYIQEAVQRITLASRYFDKSQREEALAAQYLNVAGRYLASGQAKINEFIAMLGVKLELPLFKAESIQPTEG